MRRCLGVLLAVTLVAAASVPATHAHAAPTPRAVDMFIKIAGVDLPATHGGHDGWVEIASLSLGVHRVGDCASARRHGEVEFGAVSFTMKLDAATPKLLEAASRGESFEEVKVTIREPGGSCELSFRRARFTENPRNRDAFALGYMTYEFNDGARTG